MIFLLGAPKAVPQICLYFDKYMQTLLCCVIYNYVILCHIIYVIWQLFFYCNIKNVEMCVKNKNKIMLSATLSLDVLAEELYIL